MSKIIRNTSDIAKIKNDRYPNIFRLPEHWQNNELHIDPSKNYTVDHTVSIPGISIFGAKEMIIHVLTATSNGMIIGGKGDMKTANIHTASQSKNNIKIGDVRVCEHTLALLLGVGLHADFKLSENSFPNFDEGIAKILQEVYPFLIEKGASDFVTIKEPMAIMFANGGYFIVEPDDGSCVLTVDHQLSHKNYLGTQRVIADITPQNFAHIAKARPPAYGIRTTVGKALHNYLGMEQFPGLGITFKNVVFVDQDKILNPNTDFDFGGINREVVLHEIIDKISALGILPGRFVGKVTTYFTNHKKDVKAANIIEQNLIYNR